MDRLQRRIVAIGQSAADEIEEAERAQGRYEEAIDKLRSELQVVNDVTIPGLVAANKMSTSWMDAWTSIHSRHQGLANPEGDSE
jgi:hypothetical protein